MFYPSITAMLTTLLFLDPSIFFQIIHSISQTHFTTSLLLVLTVFAISPNPLHFHPSLCPQLSHRHSCTSNRQISIFGCWWGVDSSLTHLQNTKCWRPSENQAASVEKMDTWHFRPGLLVYPTALLLHLKPVAHYKELFPYVPSNLHWENHCKVWQEQADNMHIWVHNTALLYIVSSGTESQVNRLYGL